MDDGAKALSAQNVPVPLVAEESSAECPLSSLSLVPLCFLFWNK